MKYTFLLFFTNKTFAQSDLFLKTIGFKDVSLRTSVVRAAANGDFYVAAKANSDFALLRCDARGNVLWQKTYDIKGEQDDPRDILIDTNGNVVVVGRTHQNSDTEQQGFILKINPDTQEMIWSVLGKKSTFYFAITEYNGEYIVGGNEYFSSRIGHADDALLHTINKENGQVTKQNFGYDLGQSASENYAKLLIDNGLVYAWGRFTFFQDYNYMRGTMQVFDLKKFELQRTTAYVKNGSSDAARLYGTSFIIDDASIVAAQYGQLNGSDIDRNTSVVIIKTAKNGKLEWTKSYELGYATQGAEIINADDGYYILNENKSNVAFFTVIKIDKKGNLLWSKKIDLANNATEFRASNSTSVKGFWNKNNKRLYIVSNVQDATNSDVLLLLNCDENGTIANDNNQCELRFNPVETSVINLPNVQFAANPKRYKHNFQTQQHSILSQTNNKEIFFEKIPCEKQIIDNQVVTTLKKDTIVSNPIVVTPKKDTIVVVKPIEKYDFSQAKPINLFLLLDISGSMRKNIDSLKAVLRTIIPHLRSQDYISIVTFSEANAIKLLPTSCDKQSVILATLNSLKAEGNTLFDAALLKLYEATELHYSPDYNNQIIVVSDGIFTVNKQSYLSLKENGVRFETNGFAFDAPPFYQKQFKQLARLGGGRFFNTQGDNLETYLLEVLKK